jgi:LysM repeat protein
MAMFENISVAPFNLNFSNNENEQKKVEKFEASESFKNVAKGSELDLLYKGIEKGFAKVTSSTRISQKTPGVYLGIGFAAGFLCMFVIALIVAVSSNGTGGVKEAKEDIEILKATDDIPATVVPAATAPVEPAAIKEERYVVRAGDTLGRISFRFYGKYDAQRIQRIQTLNNLPNPEALQVGQVLVIPLSR